jgi:hypothetical protein
MDFEINQATQPDLTTAGPKTLNRTAGDLLVTFDFNNGGGRPTLGLLRWVTTGSSSQCFSSNSLPCWGNHVTLNGTNSIGAVNNLDSVTDPIAPNAPRSLAALTFGETAINLTAAGVFPPGTCEAFGSAFLKSRASSSFPAEVKDFVAPIPVNISNCGEMKIVKTGKDKNCTGEGTPPIGNGVCTGASSANLSGAKFSVTGPNNYSNNVTTGGDGTVCLTALAAGSYTVTETSPPTGYKADSTSGQTVSVTPSSSCTGSSPNSVTFSDSPLTNIVAKATSQVSGATNSTITCVDSGSNNVGNSPQGPKDPAEVDANDLTPGTYTCTIVIDP